LIVFDEVAREGHEQVLYGYDKVSGLRAIIAIHSTALGPALGGTRFFPYQSEDDALEDVLRLSKGMTYKAAAAGLDLGGGKAVIIGDPRTDKSERLLRAYGRIVDSLRGRYITAEDVGTTTRDLDIVRRETRWALGNSVAEGGAGDPSPRGATGASASSLRGQPSGVKCLRSLTVKGFSVWLISGRRAVCRHSGGDLPALLHRSADARSYHKSLSPQRMRRSSPSPAVRTQTARPSVATSSVPSRSVRRTRAPARR